MIVNCTLYENGHKVANIPLTEVPAARNRQDAFVWLGLFEPDEALMAQVQALFGLHELAAEDAHHHASPATQGGTLRRSACLWCCAPRA